MKAVVLPQTVGAAGRDEIDRDPGRAQRVVQHLQRVLDHRRPPLARGCRHPAARSRGSSSRCGCSAPRPPAAGRAGRRIPASALPPRSSPRGRPRPRADCSARARPRPAGSRVPPPSRSGAAPALLLDLRLRPPPLAEIAQIGGEHRWPSNRSSTIASSIGNSVPSPRSASISIRRPTIRLRPVASRRARPAVWACAQCGGTITSPSCRPITASRQAEHALRRRIELAQDARIVHQDHAIQRRLDHRPAERSRRWASWAGSGGSAPALPPAGHVAAPRTVRSTCGRAGSRSILRRSRAIWTSMLRCRRRPAPASSRRRRRVRLGRDGGGMPPAGPAPGRQRQRGASGRRRVRLAGSKRQWPITDLAGGVGLTPRPGRRGAARRGHGSAAPGSNGLTR